MKRSLIVLFSLIAGCIIANVSCKKSPKSVTCMVTSYVDTFGNKISLTYDNSNRITGITNANFPSSHRKFIYEGTNIYIQQTDSAGNISENDTAVLNSKGMIATLAINDSALYPIPVRIRMNYDANQQLVSTVITGASNPAFTFDSTVYKWLNGDLVSAYDAFPQSVATYEYYILDETATGDVAASDQLNRYGGLYIKTKHLSKSINSGQHYEYYTYDMSDSKISTSYIVITDSVTNIKYNERKYQITCK